MKIIKIIKVQVISLLFFLIACSPPPNTMVRNSSIEVWFNLPDGFSANQKFPSFDCDKESQDCFRYMNEEIGYRMDIFISEPYPNYSISKEFIFEKNSNELMHHNLAKTTIDSSFVIKNKNWWSLEVVDTTGGLQEKFMWMVEQPYKGWNVRFKFHGQNFDRIGEYKKLTQAILFSVKFKTR